MITACDLINNILNPEFVNLIGYSIFGGKIDDTVCIAVTKSLIRGGSSLGYPLFLFRKYY